MCEFAGSRSQRSWRLLAGRQLTVVLLLKLGHGLNDRKGRLSRAQHKVEVLPTFALAH